MLLAHVFAGCVAPEEVMEIRTKVFVEEQGFSAESERDQWDAVAFHVVVYDEDTPIATGRLYWDAGTYHAGRFAVLKEHRGKGAGEMAVRLLSKVAYDMGGEAVELHAQMHAVPFYEKIGYKVYGEPILDEGVPHAQMRMTQEDFYASFPCKKKR